MVQNVEPQEAFFVPVEGGTNTLPWRYLAASEHTAALLDAFGQVTRDLVYGAEFSIAPEGDTLAGVGEITLIAAPTASETQLRVRGDAAATQAVPAEPGTAPIVASLDRMAIVVQQVREGIARVDVPAEIEASQAAAAQAQVWAQAAAASAALAATFDPDNFQPIAQALTDISGATVGAKGLELLATTGGMQIRTIAGLELSANADWSVDTAKISTRAVTKSFVDSRALGIGQGWDDVTSERSHSTWWQNTFGRSIQLSIFGNGQTRFVQTSSDLVTIRDIGQTGRTVSGTNYSYGVQFTVPPDDYVRIDGSTNFTWMELS